MAASKATMRDGPSANPRALSLGGDAVLLPEGARAVAAPTAVRPLPGANPGLLGVAVLGGRAVPVWCAGGVTPSAWVLADTAWGPTLLGGDALMDAAPPDARPLALPPSALRHHAAPRAGTRLMDGGWAESRAPQAFAESSSATPAALTLRLGDLAVAVPLAAMEGLRPWPDLISPPPSGHAAALGYAATAHGPALLLDAFWCAGRSPETGPAAGDAVPGFVAVLRASGRRLGVPCARAEPGASGADLLARLAATEEGRLLLALAPAAEEPAAAPPGSQPLRPLLVCRAGERIFAVAAEEVVAVIGARDPSPLPGGRGRPLSGVLAHRGEVLPVLDAAGTLGGAGAGTAGPYLRLASSHPVALAVTQVLGLRNVARAALVPVSEHGPVAALATLNEGVVPVCRAVALAGA